MSQWLPEFSGEAERDLAHLDRRIQERVLEKIDWFLKNFDSIVHIPLAGEYRDFFKLRIGDWRIFLFHKMERRYHKN